MQVEVETARPQIRQVATFVEDSLCVPAKLKYAARLSHALTLEGNSHVRMCVHRIKAAATNLDFSVR